MKKLFTLALAIMSASLPGWTQKADVAAILGYPQMILLGSKALARVVVVATCRFCDRS